jgi:hypothetical protein
MEATAGAAEGKEQETHSASEWGKKRSTNGNTVRSLLLGALSSSCLAIAPDRMLLRR